MKSTTPLSNGLALLITLGVAAGFFALFMAIPAQKPVTNTSGPSTGIRASTVVLFNTRCSQCHALPSLTHRTSEDWRILVLKMNRYMKQTGRLSLTDKEVMNVTQYIVQNQK